MPQFDFHLDGVLHQRKNIEREKQRLLAIVISQMAQLEQQLRALDADVQATTADVRQNHLTGPIDLSFLTAHRRYLAATQRRAMAIANRMSVVQRDVDEARAALAAAARDRKVLEKLRERQKEAWQMEINRKESAALDEMAMQISYRQMSELVPDGAEREQGGES